MRHKMKGENMTTYEIVFYEKQDGTEPVKDFIMNLLPKMQAKTI